MSMPESFNPITYALAEKPLPILGAETVQLILAREIHDFTVLRTEETREINTVVTPYSRSDMDRSVLRAAFLGSKQKAVETRYFRSILNSAAKEHGIALEECYMKDNLCMMCPRCVLFGAVRTAGTAPNIKHRIEYSTAFSLMPFEDIAGSLTFNAVDEATQKTKQALGTVYAIQPATIFPSIVTLRSASWKELLMTIKTLLAAKSYGAESRVRGDVRNVLLGVVAGWEELFTPLELTVYLMDVFEKKGEISAQDITSLVTTFTERAAFRDKVAAITGENLDVLVNEVSAFKISKEFFGELIKDSKEFHADQIAKDK